MNYRSYIHEHMPKWCTHCMTYKPRKNGTNMSPNPLREQWWCSDCVSRFQEKVK